MSLKHGFNAKRVWLSDDCRFLPGAFLKRGQKGAVSREPQARVDSRDGVDVRVSANESSLLIRADGSDLRSSR